MNYVLERDDNFNRINFDFNLNGRCRERGFHI